ncbi:MAG: hypothetical protein F9K32_20200 [Desulfobulbaceae bacterium]|nr:MAG: hypothetical protein F9K32_20200 [Desulfobulbaceae bacterium]
MLRIHFLNVGHGDCIVVEFVDHNRVAVIDINRSCEFDESSKKELEQEFMNAVDATTRLSYLLKTISFSDLAEKAGETMTLQDPIEYLNEKGIHSIFRFISTHPHMDHLTGLNALNENNGIGNIWILRNTFCQEEKKLTEDQKVDWQLYTKYRDTMNNPVDGTTILRPFDGDLRNFWDEDGIYILAPNEELLKLAHARDNRNIMSYVLLIKYGKHKIVLGGDAEEDTWKYITDKYADLITDVRILKASHHGRDSGYYQPAVKLMNPEFTIVSMGKKPKTDASNKYKQYSTHVWSTRWKGNIVFELNADGTGTYLTQFDRLNLTYG